MLALVTLHTRPDFSHTVSSIRENTGFYRWADQGAILAIGKLPRPLGPRLRTDFGDSEYAGRVFQELPRREVAIDFISPPDPST